VNTPNTIVAWRLAHLEKAVEKLDHKVDRLQWALAVAALSLAGTSALLILQLLAHL